MSELKNNVLTECARMQESCSYTSLQHFIVAKCWRSVHLTIGILATALASLSSVLTYAEPTSFAGPLAASVAILAGLLTFLAPRDRADEHHSKGVQYNQLVTNGRMLRELDAQIVDDSALAGRLRELYARKFELDENGPAAPASIFYAIAKRQIKKGQTSFAVDLER